MNDPAALYQRIVLDHNRAPRNFRIVRPCTHHAEVLNPVCGDRITLYLDVRNARIEDIGFQGDACAIATASASLLTDVLRQRSAAEARALARAFEQQLAGHAGEGDRLEPLQPLLQVREYPGRLKCVLLPWYALEAALNGDVAHTVSSATDADAG